MVQVQEDMVSKDELEIMMTKRKRTLEELEAAWSAGGQRGGRARAAKLTREERTDIARKAGRASGAARPGTSPRNSAGTARERQLRRDGPNDRYVSQEHFWCGAPHKCGCFIPRRFPRRRPRSSSNS
jgi:general stress protein YciG